MASAYFSRHDKQFKFSFDYICTENNLNNAYSYTLYPGDKIEDLQKKIQTSIQNTIKRKLQKDAKESSSEEKVDTKSQVKPVLVKIVQNGKDMGAMHCKQFNNVTKDVQLIINDYKYNVLINKPCVVRLVLPKCLYVNFPVHLSDFSSILCDSNQNNQFMWHKSTDKINWVQIAESNVYVPTAEDVDCYLKVGCVPKNAKDTGILRETISEEKVTIFAETCPFERRHTHTMEGLTEKSFRIVSYNILADAYCKFGDMYPYCPSEVIDIDYRKQLIFKEIQGYNADVICLQEVDYKVYKGILRVEFTKLNYKGHYNPKEHRPEGLVCLYKTSRFKHVYTQCIVIGKEVRNHKCFVDFRKRLLKNKHAAASLMDQNTILQILVLESKENKEIIFVANTHLFYHPEYSHIRLLQVAASLIFIENKMKKFEMNGLRTSVIFCGDFNSMPDSGVYKFFTKGHVPPDAKDWSSNDKEVVKNMTVGHKRNFVSAYGTPKYTNYTEDFKACLDYIFYEKNNLEVKQVVPLLTEEEMSANTAMPNVGIPSDHVALVVDFEWL